jgi:hypothetical protein
MYRDEETFGTYWVVALEGGRNVILTDHSEDYLIWVEGPWPFAATFSGPDGVRTEIDHSINSLVARIVTPFLQPGSGMRSLARSRMLSQVRVRVAAFQGLRR